MYAAVPRMTPVSVPCRVIVGECDKSAGGISSLKARVLEMKIKNKKVSKSCLFSTLLVPQLFELEPFDSRGNVLPHHDGFDLGNDVRMLAGNVMSFPGILFEVIKLDHHISLEDVLSDPLPGADADRLLPFVRRKLPIEKLVLLLRS
jgi:hypothetical protein